jgi:hypothetical protein
MGVGREVNHEQRKSHKVAKSRTERVIQVFIVCVSRRFVVSQRVSFINVNDDLNMIGFPVWLATEPLIFCSKPLRADLANTEATNIVRVLADVVSRVLVDYI